MKARRVIVKTFNVVAWVLLVASSLYSILEPDIWSFTKEAEILPARWGFYVWYPLNVLLVAPILCQFVPDGNLLIIDGLSWDLPLLNTSTAIFIHLWIREWYLTAFFFVVLSRLTLHRLRSILREYNSDVTLAETLFVRLPLSFYASWMDVLLVVVGFQAFTVSWLNYSTRMWVKGDAGLWTEVFVFIALGYLLSATITSAIKITTAVRALRHNRTPSLPLPLSPNSGRSLIYALFPSDTFLPLSDLAYTIPITWNLWAIFWLHLHPFWYSLPGHSAPPGSLPPSSTDLGSHDNSELLKYGTLTFAILSSICVVVAALRVIVWVVKGWKRSGGIIRVSVEVEDWSWGGDGRSEMTMGRGEERQRRIGRWEVGAVKYGSYGYTNVGGVSVRLAGEEMESV